MNNAASTSNLINREASIECITKVLDAAMLWVLHARSSKPLLWESQKFNVLPKRVFINRFDKMRLSAWGCFAVSSQVSGALMVRGCARWEHYPWVCNHFQCKLQWCGDCGEVRWWPIYLRSIHFKGSFPMQSSFLVQSLTHDFQFVTYQSQAWPTTTWIEALCRQSGEQSWLCATHHHAFWMISRCAQSLPDSLVQETSSWTWLIWRRWGCMR